MTQQRPLISTHHEVSTRRISFDARRSLSAHPNGSIHAAGNGGKLTQVRQVIDSILSVSAIGSLLSGCKLIGGLQQYACDITVNSPHISSGEKKKGKIAIVGKATAVCDQAPLVHYVWMTLEVQQGKKWTPMANGERDDRLPGAKRVTYQVNFNDCQPGVWRTSVKIDAKNAEGKPGSLTDSSQTKEITAEDCNA